MSRFLQKIQSIPAIGFGLGLKDDYVAALLAHQAKVNHSNNFDAVDWLEIIPENYMKKGGASYAAIENLKKAKFPFASHGVNLSIGSVDRLNEDYLQALEALFKRVEPHWFSDHLCFSSIDGKYFNDLLPLPFSQEAISQCVENIKSVQQRFEIPFLIENISYYANFNPENLSEAEFLSEIIEQADCGLLLDVNNVYVNAKNHQYDPIQFIDALPLERVIEIHIAGHLAGDDFIIDTHGETVIKPVYELLSYVYKKCPNLKGVLLERDTNLPEFTVLIDELAQVRAAAIGSLREKTETDKVLA